jgi:hypothetical protein
MRKSNCGPVDENFGSAPLLKILRGRPQALEE